VPVPRPQPRHRLRPLGLVIAPSVDGSVGQNAPIFKAIAELTRGLATDKNTQDYENAIAHLRAFSETPDAMVTPAERGRANADVSFLDVFFHTPSLWGPGGLCANAPCT
jgi:hypothetical protein